MGYTCCVPGCYNRSSAQSTLKFHRFPENQALRRKWITAINRRANNSNALFQPDSRSHRVCSSHFQGGVKEAKSLPSIFPRHNATPKYTRQTNTSQRAGQPASPRRPTDQERHVQREQLLIQAEVCVPEIGAEVEIGCATSNTEVLQSVKSKDSDHTYYYPSIPPVSPTKRKLQKTLQTTSNDVFTLMKSLSAAKAEVKQLKARTTDIDIVINDNDTLNLYTGFKNATHFKSLIEFLKPDEQHIIYPGEKQISGKLSLENCVLLTLMKYKLDAPQDDLAFR